jgi:hypothetical protein
MDVELFIAPEAEQDIADAYGWYEDRRTGLGEDFLSCVDACIQGICRTPQMHVPIYENTTVGGWCDASHTRSATNMRRIP